MSGSLTLGRWIRDRAVVTPERVAIDFCDETTTYAELAERAEGLAAAMLAAGGQPGDRVAVLAGNRPETVEVLFACALAGLVLLPLNPRLAARELAWQLDDAEPRALLVHPDHESLADAVIHQIERRPRPQVVAMERPQLDELAARAGGRGARLGEVGDDAGLLLIYTSGTTGRPKGAVLTHANCFWTNLSFDRTADVTTTDVVLQVLPQFHVGGWNVQPLLAWWKGATVVLEPTFDAERALELIARKRVTTMMGVPATYLFMAEQSGFADADLTNLRQAVVGGAPMPERLLRTYHERQVALVQGYGLTEAAPNVLCLPAEDATRKLGYAGKPYPHVDVALRDTDSGSWLEGPARGELCVRGENVFAGYWRNAAATAETIVDGWLRTGDVAERDDEGFYRIVDRTKDLYVSGGENVYPAEVEAVLADHPDVVEAAVVGVSDVRWGEVGYAVVVPRSGTDLDEDALAAHCGERLARYKTPRHWSFVEELPRSTVGKVLKNELRAERERAAGSRGSS